MNRCCDYKEMIPAYLEGELEQKTAEELKQHFESCPQCFQELQQWEKIFNLLELPEEDPGPDFAASVMEAVHREEQRAAASPARTIRNPWNLRNLTIGLVMVFLLACTLPTCLIANSVQLPLFYAAAELTRAILKAIVDLLPVPLAAVFTQAGSILLGFWSAVLFAAKQCLLLLLSLMETLFILVRALPPTTWVVLLTLGFTSSLLLGKLLGTDYKIEPENF